MNYSCFTEYSPDFSNLCMISLTCITTLEDTLNVRSDISIVLPVCLICNKPCSCGYFTIEYILTRKKDDKKIGERSISPRICCQTCAWEYSRRYPYNFSDSTKHAYLKKQKQQQNQNLNDSFAEVFSSNQYSQQQFPQVSSVSRLFETFLENRKLYPEHDSPLSNKQNRINSPVTNKTFSSAERNRSFSDLNMKEKATISPLKIKGSEDVFVDRLRVERFGIFQKRKSQVLPFWRYSLGPDSEKRSKSRQRKDSFSRQEKESNLENIDFEKYFQGFSMTDADSFISIDTSVSSESASEFRPFLCVVHVVKTSPADKVGLEEGDLFLKFGNIDRNSFSGNLEQIIAYVREHKKNGIVVVAKKKKEGTVIEYFLKPEVRREGSVELCAIGMVLNIHN